MVLYSVCRRFIDPKCVDSEGLSSEGDTPKDFNFEAGSGLGNFEDETVLI